MTITTEQAYTAYALTSRGREKIECYGTVEEAVQDILELWPEEVEEGLEASDVGIENNEARLVVLMVRGADNRAIAHVYYRKDGAALDRIESYHCQYEPAHGGSVRTIVRKLG